MDYSKKRFLITHSGLRLLAGSEIVTLELAEYLINRGAEVVVYACFFANPIKKFFDTKNITVTTDDRGILLEDFDYIWVNHQVIPVSIIQQLCNPKALPGKLPGFIFNHMSALPAHFLEQSYIWEMEQKISSKTLYVSLATQQIYNEIVGDISRLNDVALFRNPAPIKFKNYKKRIRKTPKKILIVSNHPPEELILAKKKLKSLGYEVTSLGENQDEYKLIEPDFLGKHDIVITIGKTVQYCLVANIPVFIYDHFGGPGYLNEKNENLAAKRNYSGRGFTTKESNEIVEEVVAGYSEAVKYQSKNHSRFVDELSIDKVLDSLLSNVKQKGIRPLNKYYAHYLVGVIIMMKYKFYHENTLIVLEKTSKEKIDKLNKINNKLNRVNKKLNKEFTRANKELQKIKDSRAYRATLTLVKPINKAKKILKKS